MDENLPDHIDDVFRDALRSARQKPPPEIWDHIENQLDKDDRDAYIIRLRIVLLIAACCLVLLVPVSLLYNSSPENHLVRSNRSVSDARDKGISGTLKKSRSGSADPAAGFTGKRLTDRHSMVSVPETQRIRPGQNQGSLSAVSLHPLNVRFYGPGPDQGHRLLADQLSRFKNTNLVRASHRSGRWSVTGYFSKEFAGYSLTDRDSMAANGKEIDKKERPVYSASAMILVNYQLTEKWVFQSGLGYSWSNSIANPTTAYAVNNNGMVKFQVNTLSGYGYLPTSSSGFTRIGDSGITDKSYTRLRYLTIPFIASYRFGIRRLTVMAGMGVTFNMLASATLETRLQGVSYNQEESVVSMHGLKPINYGVLLKTELQYPVCSGWSANLVVTFKNTVTPINLHTVIYTYPYNMGIGIGISHRFPSAPPYPPPSDRQTPPTDPPY